MKEMKNAIKYFMAIFIMVTAFCMIGVPVSAAGVTQTDQTTSSVTISWPANEKAIEYSVIIGKDYYEVKDAIPVTVPAGTTSYTFTGLEPGTQYMVNVKYTYQGFSQTATGSIGSTDVKTLSAKVSGVKQKSWSYYAKAVIFEWKDQPAADYEYVIKNHKNKVVEKQSTGIRQATFNKVDNNVVYQLQVRAYVVINGKKYYSGWSDKTYLFTQPMIKTAGISRKKLTIKWNKVNGVTGYDVYVSTKVKSGYKKVKSLNAKKTSCTLSKFKGKKFNAGKTYYMYIVGKKKVGGKTYKTGKNTTYKLEKGKCGQEIGIAS